MPSDLDSVRNRGGERVCDSSRAMFGMTAHCLCLCASRSRGEDAETQRHQGQVHLNTAEHPQSAIHRKRLL